MVVAVEQHEVALGDEVGEHDLVRRRSAVEDEIGFLGPEDRRSLFLGLQRRPFVGEKIAEFEDRIVEVVAKDRFTQMLDENAPDGAAAIEDAAVVAGTGPELVALFLVVDERAEERGLQRVGVLLEARDEIAGDEFGRLLGQEHIAVDEVEHFDRNVLEALAPDQDDDRHVEAALPHEVDERGRLALDSLLAPVDHHAADGGVRLHGDLSVLDAPRLDDLEPHPLDGGDDLVDPEALEIIGVEHRRREQKGQTLGKVHRLMARQTGPLAHRPEIPALRSRQTSPGRLLKTASRDTIKSGPPDQDQRRARADAPEARRRFAVRALSLGRHCPQLVCAPQSPAGRDRLCSTQALIFCGCQAILTSRNFKRVMEWQSHGGDGPGAIDMGIVNRGVRT